jgi:hypothetical protein
MLDLVSSKHFVLILQSVVCSLDVFFNWNGIAQWLKGLATGKTTGIQFPSGSGNYLLATMASYQWVPWDLSPGVERWKHEADHSSTSKVRNTWSNTSSAPHFFLVWCLGTGTDISLWVAEFRPINPMLFVDWTTCTKRLSISVDGTNGSYTAECESNFLASSVIYLR